MALMNTHRYENLTCSKMKRKCLSVRVERINHLYVCVERFDQTVCLSMWNALL